MFGGGALEAGMGILGSQEAIFELHSGATERKKWRNEGSKASIAANDHLQHARQKVFGDYRPAK